MFSVIEAKAQFTTTWFEDWVKTGGSQPSQVQNEFLERVAAYNDPLFGLYVASSSYNETTLVYDLQIGLYDDIGNTIWSTSFNIPNGGDVLIGNVTADGLGNAFFTGAVDNANNSFDALTVKFSSTGSVTWYNTYNGAANGYDGGVDIILDATGNAFVTGVATQNTVSRDFLTMAYSPSGNLTWSQLYDGAGLVDVAAEIGFSGGNLIVIGAEQNSLSSWNMVAVRYNPNTGVELGNSTLSPNIVVDEINGFTTDVNENIYIVGAKRTVSSGHDAIVLKLDSGLNILWEETYDSSGGDDVANAVAVDANGNVTVVGYATTSSNTDYLVLHYNSSGALQWSDLRNGEDFANDAATDVEVDANGDIYVTGNINDIGNSDFYTVLYEQNGTEIWSEQYNSVYNREDKAALIELDDDGNFLVTGWAVALDFQSNESINVTTVKYSQRDYIIPPDPDPQSKSITFVKNNGQLFDDSGQEIPHVKYYTRRNPIKMYFTDDRVSYVLSKIDDDSMSVDTITRVDMTILNSGRNPVAATFPGDEEDEHENHYKCRDPEGRELVPTFSSITQSEVYDGIDLRYSTNESGVKYYFIVKPGSSPSTIELGFSGYDNLSVSQAGDLLISTPLTDIVLTKGDAYQVDGGGNKLPLSWQPSYVVTGNVVTFTVGSFNNAQPLIMEVYAGPPSSIVVPGNLEWSTFLGGFDEDLGHGVDTDAAGNVYVTGLTSSFDFPGVVGTVAQPMFGGVGDAYVSKFDLATSLVWTTFYGGCFVDYGKSIIASQDGNVYFVGLAGNKFPLKTMGGAYNQTFFGDGITNDPNNLNDAGDGFIVSLAPEGTSTWATYFGGYTLDEAIDIEEDKSGNLIIGGVVWDEANIGGTPTQIEGGQPLCSPPSQNNGFPMCNSGFFNTSFSGGLNDSYIAKFDANRSLVWSTFFGGSQTDVLADVAISETDNSVYITGETTSNIAGNSNNCGVPNNSGFPLCDSGGGAYFQNSFPAISSYDQNAYIAQFSNNGDLLWSTYYGGADQYNRGETIVIGPTGDIYTSGLAIFGNNGPLQPDVFCNVTGNEAFPLCDPGNGAFFDANVDGSGNPINPRSDLYIGRFNSSKQLVWSTYFGSDNGHEYSSGIISQFGTVVNAELDIDNRFYLTGHTQQNSETGLLPVLEKPGYYYQDTPAGGGGTTDAFVANFDQNNVSEWVTYFGGGEREDFGSAIAIDRENRNLYIVGTTESNDFPVEDFGGYFQPVLGGPNSLGFSYDAFVSRFKLDGAVSTQECFQSSGDVSIFPNPSSGIINIDFKNALTGDLDIRLFNTIGQELPLALIGKSIRKVSVSFGNLPAGVYLIQVQIGDNLIVKKVVRN